MICRLGRLSIIISVFGEKKACGNVSVRHFVKRCERKNDETSIPVQELSIASRLKQSKEAMHAFMMLEKRFLDARDM